MSNLFKPEKISLLNHPTIKESHIQNFIAENPSILNLGDLIIKDKERSQPSAGRLDLLLQDPDTSRRYEVEIQLGRTDESHIIRTLEYWDIERKRYPQYDHCSIIIAEDITSRFLNVINLFNGSIPIIAIQIGAYKFGDDIGLVFTKVLDELTLGLVDEDESSGEVKDRNYWISRGTEETVKIADNLLNIINEISNDNYELKYNNFYIGLIKDGQVNNFVIFRPQKSALRLELRINYSDDIKDKIENSGLDYLGYDKVWNKFKFRILPGDLENKVEIIKELLIMSYENK